ncbi:MAG: sugar ABC transporter permease [Clostridia bacterium]|nr:sugar ABC transporter permease [Clostridia bacterium]
MKSRKSRTLKRIAPNWDLYIMILIPLILLLVFAYYPMFGLQIAFKRYSASGGIWGSQWVGLDQFSKMFNTPKFVQVFFNTLKISVYYILVKAVVTVFFAMLLNVVRNKYYKKTVQMITYMPYFISTVIMVGILSQLLNSRIGLYGNICNLFGIEAVDIWSKPQYFAHIYVWSGIWQNLGWNSVIYLAALSSVDQELYEAASIEGASRFKQLIHIDFPSIMPTFVILFILSVGSMMSLGYEKVLLMQNPLNLSASEIISTYSYKVALQTGTDYSYGTAISLFDSVINLVFMAFVNQLSKKVTDSSLW